MPGSAILTVLRRRLRSDRDYKGLCGGVVGIDQHANAHGSRLQLMQQSKLLCPKLSSDKRDTGDIAARPVETGDEAELNRVAAACVDDRDRRSRRLGYN